MCGIIAYLGSGEVIDILLDGLERMEYRGYDSSGLAVISADTNTLSCVKKMGKVKNLRSALAGGKERNTRVGIAHTRWATHGAPSDANAHPHLSHDGTIAVVHNGIIENYCGIREALENLGYKFKSDTDTEALAILLGHIMSIDPSLDLTGAVTLAIQQITGAFGIAVIHSKWPNMMVGARKGSPLILGVGSDSLLLASDATAVVGHADQILYLEDGDIVHCVLDGKTLEYSVKNVSIGGTCRLRASSGTLDISSVDMRALSCAVTRELHELTMNIESIEKGGYEHFMLKEIMEQPKVLRDCMGGRIDSCGEISLGGVRHVLPRIIQARRIIICGCGTSWHSGLVGEYLIENFARIPVEVEYASEFRYRNPILSPQDVVIVVSQSGETADTLEAAWIAKKHKCLVIGIVNVVGSSIARVTDAGTYLHVGPEISVASTKAFTGQVVAFAMLGIVLGRENGTLSTEVARLYGAELAQIPSKIETMLTKEAVEQCRQIASTFRFAENFFFLGRGCNFPVALEGALKLKEISYIHAEGFPNGECKHGHIALVDPKLPVVVVTGPKSSASYSKVVSGIEEIVARGGCVISVTETGKHSLERLSHAVIMTPSTTCEFFTPLLSVIPLQLISYYIANFRQAPVDRPRNLAKSVTVE